MCDEGYITAQERDIITDVYTTYYFNQPYQNVEGTLVLGSNPDYAPTDDLVLHYVNIADKNGKLKKVPAPKISRIRPISVSPTVNPSPIPIPSKTDSIGPFLDA